MTIAPGQRFPLGASVVEGGVNFCVYSRRAKRLELLLFDGAVDAEPALGIVAEGVLLRRPDDLDIGHGLPVLKPETIGTATILGLRWQVVF